MRVRVFFFPVELIFFQSHGLISNVLHFDISYIIQIHRYFIRVFIRFVYSFQNTIIRFIHELPL